MLLSYTWAPALFLRALYPAEGAYPTAEERSKDFAFCKTRLAEQGNEQHH
ncbi:MAG: hypothetical protein ACR2JJ_00965 [Sphingomicrobium sp.]